MIVTFAPSTVSKWCTNSSRPDLPSLLKIADLLEVDIRELIVREYKQFIISTSSKDLHDRTYNLISGKVFCTLINKETPS